MGLGSSDKLLEQVFLGLNLGWNLLSGEFGAEGFEAVELFQGAAVLALGLGLVAKEEGPDVGFFRLVCEAIGHAKVAILGAGDLDIAIADEVLGHGLEGAIVGGHGVVHGYGEETCL